MKKIVALAAIALFALTGCASTSATPSVTETVYVSPDDNSGNSYSSIEAEFEMYMGAVGTPQWMLDDPEIMAILIDQANNTCGYIDDGQSKDDIVWMLTLASESSNPDQVVMDAMLAATVAATYTYCPEYEGFFE